METLIILALTIGGFLFYLYRKDKEDRVERAKWLNAILAKDTQEHMNLQAMENVVEDEPEQEERFADTSTLTDEEYLKMETELNV